MNDIILKILECVISIAVIVICRYVIPAIKSKVGVQQYELALTYIMEVVKACQQTLEDNNFKKETATEQVSKFLESKGIKMSSEEIDILIESAVRELKAQEGRI